jgi:hypothetical protein
MVAGLYLAPQRARMPLSRAIVVIMIVSRKFRPECDLNIKTRA